MTQTTRVLGALRQAGETGITAYDFCGWKVIDGGDRIMRVAARILELREQGFDIRSGGERDGHVIYRLWSEPTTGPVVRGSATHAPDPICAADPVVDSGQLFEMPKCPGSALHGDAA